MNAGDNQNPREKSGGIKTLQEQLAWVRKAIESNSNLRRIVPTEHSYWDDDKAHLESIEASLISLLTLTKDAVDP